MLLLVRAVDGRRYQAADRDYAGQQFTILQRPRWGTRQFSVDNGATWHRGSRLAMQFAIAQAMRDTPLFHVKPL